MRSFKKSRNAYSLTETMVVLVLVGILMTIAMPAFRNVLITSKISVAASTLHSALLFARSEAIKRGRPVTICRSSNPEGVVPSCAAGNINPEVNMGWGEGWLIFVDIDMDAKYTSIDNLIRVQNRLFDKAGDGAIIANPHRNQLTFNATGQIFASYTRFTVSRPSNDPDNSHVKYLCLASGGRARIDMDVCGNH